MRSLASEGEDKTRSHSAVKKVGGDKQFQRHALIRGNQRKGNIGEMNTDLINFELRQAARAAVLSFVVEVLDHLPKADQISKRNESKTIDRVKHLFKNPCGNFRKFDASSALLHEQSVRRCQNGCDRYLRGRGQEERSNQRRASPLIVLLVMAHL